MLDNESATQALDQKIKEACAGNGLSFDDLDLGDTADLVELGVFDSMGFLQLVATLEDELEIEIDLSEYSPEEFTTYGGLISIITGSAG